MNHTATHVYAVVRVKIIGTSLAGGTPAEIADRVANAVAADSSAWMQPISGTVRAADGNSFDVEHVEFADEVNWVLVDEIDDEGQITEHHFDHNLQPMQGLSGYATALEAELTAKCREYESEIQRLKYSSNASLGPP